MDEFPQTDFCHQAFHNFQYRVVDSDVEVVAPMRVCATIPCENVRARRCETAWQHFGASACGDVARHIPVCGTPCVLVACRAHGVYRRARWRCVFVPPMCGSKWMPNFVPEMGAEFCAEFLMPISVS